MVNNLFGPCLQGIGMLGNTFQHDAIVIWFYSRGLLSAYVSPGQAELPEMRQSCSCCIKDIVICSALISRFSSIPLSLRRSFTSIFSLAVNPTDWKRQICCLSWHRQTVIAWEVYVCVYVKRSMEDHVTLKLCSGLCSVLRWTRQYRNKRICVCFSTWVFLYITCVRRHILVLEPRLSSCLWSFLNAIIIIRRRRLEQTVKRYVINKP